MSHIISYSSVSYSYHHFNSHMISYSTCLESQASVVSMDPLRQVGFSRLAAERIGPNHFEPGHGWAENLPWKKMEKPMEKI